MKFLTLNKLLSFLKNSFYFCFFVSFLVLFHELGHLLTALVLGIQPKVFSIGFGSALTSFKAFDISWQIAPIPLGGYVSFEIQDILQNPGKWVLIGLAGPVFNFIQAVILAGIFFKTFFKQIRILGYDGHQLTFKVLPHKLFISGADEVILDNQTLEKIGFNHQQMTFSYNTSIKLWLITQKMPTAFSNLMKKLTLKHDPPEVGGGLVGPIGIAKLLSDSVTQSWSRIILLNSQLAIGLGFFNLIPLPFLDGGKILQASLMLIFTLDYESSLKYASILGMVFFLYHMLKRK